MNSRIELVSDGDGLAVIGNSAEVESFFIDLGLDRTSSEDLDLRRLWPLLSTGGAALQVGSELAANSGRWVKLTKDSAKAVKQYGLMATKTPGVSHAMVGKRGDIKQWLQIAQGPSLLLSGPLALSAMSTLMQQQAMQRQIDEIVEYLQEINEKVDDILRGQKDAVLADMIGVGLIVEEALTVRNQVGRVSEVTWSKVQATPMTIARTQVYALRQLDAIAEKLEKKTDPGHIARAAKATAPEVREWLAVLARCFQLQDGVSVLELDRVLDAAPEDLDQHRFGLIAARQNRLELISRSTARLLAQMDEAVGKANSKVLLNPFDSPAAVRSSHQIAADLLNFRERLGIESGYEASEARRWGQAATEARDKAFTTASAGVDAARRFGVATFDQAGEAFRAVDIDGDGIPDKSRALSAVEDAGSAIKGAGVAIGAGAGNAASAIGGLLSGAAGAAGSLLRRKQETVAPSNDLGPETGGECPEGGSSPRLHT